ncbi:hypothetical protein GpartN1_g5522.t1 [Galdieria partita]|uniref:Uncharacterized protein n=1 Tax=Galdieria partita TaxID=83374 RepID=A0A9C7UQL2_9RHOD|nr:hypothetical protein GpartN1_g3845.t1 [Galdieria partita]GJQ13731.1 hypothetical protein GpartN1_g5522.t1 [Galdieria partita]
MSSKNLDPSFCCSGTNKGTSVLSKSVKNTGRKRKLRNMDDLFSLLTQVKERAINLEARVKRVEEFSNKSSCNHFGPKEGFDHSLEEERNPQLKDDVQQPARDPFVDLIKESQTVPILDDFQQPLLETEGTTMEAFQDWFENSVVDYV